MAQGNAKKPIVVIYGPTASGKSALALALAEKLGGMIINADSMQVYGDLRILTARPAPDEEARAPHRLFGVLAASDICSAARWAQMARAAILEADEKNLWPILVGGTGMYLKTLFDGIAPVPAIPDAVRRAARDLLATLGPEGLYEELRRIDPAMAALLAPRDKQRLLRAWEVMTATGQSLAQWRAQPGAGLDRARFVVCLMPPREDLYARIDARFEAMMQGGALDEVRAWAARGPIDPLWPLARAHGVPELRAFLEGRLSRAEAIARAQQITRHYAKRQMTWARGQLDCDATIENLADATNAPALAARLAAQLVS